MKVIYQHVTARRRPGDWMNAKTISATLVCEASAAKLRVTIHFDASYDFQSHGQISVLKGNEAFAPLLSLHWTEIPCIVSWEKMDHPERGDMLRDGDTFERSIIASLHTLAALGFKILGIDITKTDITTKMLWDAAAIDDLNDALKPLMDAAGIDAGDGGAWQWFSGQFSPDYWPRLSHQRRLDCLTTWLKVEREAML